MRAILISDIHSNWNALQSVLRHARNAYGNDWNIFQAGDLINYGPRPNKIVDAIEELDMQKKIVANLAGNHEAALFGIDANRYSTGRGFAALQFTATELSKQNTLYLKEKLSYEPLLLEIAGKKILCVHGCLSDPLWGKMTPEEMNSVNYKKYDLVMSGHSHIPGFTEVFFPDENADKRNKKKTIFLNAGSVGQPRNHRTEAQYVFMDLESETFHFNKVKYDIDEESRYFSKDVDEFYKTRLQKGV